MTALLVVATVVYSFQRFENETAYRRGMAFLGRVVSMYDNIFDMHEQSPEEFQRWLRGLVLYETDTELYLLDSDRPDPRQDRPGRSSPARGSPSVRCASRSSAWTPRTSWATTPSAWTPAR